MSYTIRTDSEGTIYLFYEQFQSPFFVENPVGTQFLVRSFNGGASWTRPVAIDTERDPCPLLQFDGSTQRLGPHPNHVGPYSGSLSYS